ncbi:MAG: hypothetical protein NZ765_03670 [Anaerolineae bacterium]|nr:hypothetical protein [Anaerolineae bacterium]MDW8070643.1 hypothetical protein [Anaerolineae bacterium]
MSVEDARSARSTRTTDFLGLLWRVLTSPRLTLVALLWLGGVIGLSQIIPQPLYSLEEPLAYSQWFANMPQFLWPWVDDLRTLGFFHLRTSVWLRLPLALLFFHALAMCTFTFPVAWRRTWARAELTESLEGSQDETPPTLGRPLGLAVWYAASVEHVFSHTTQRLVQDGYTVQSNPRAWLGLAWRRRLGWWALCGVYIGLALLAIGLLWHSWLSRTHVVELQPSQTISVPGFPELKLRLEDIRITGDPLDPSQGVAQVRRANAESDSEVITLPLHAGRMIGGMWWTVVDIVPRVEVTAWDVRGNQRLELWSFVPLARATERVRLSLSGEGNASFASLPTQNVTVRVGHASEKDVPAGRFTLSFFHGVETDPAWVATLGDGDEVIFEGVRYRTSLSYDVQLRIQQGWGWVLAASGWLSIALGGLSLVLCRPIWLVMRTQEAAGGCHMTIWVDTLAPHTPSLEWLHTLGRASADEERLGR